MTANYSQKQFERPKYMETTKFDCPLRAKNWEAQVKGNTQFDSQLKGTPKQKDTQNLTANYGAKPLWRQVEENTQFDSQLWPKFLGGPNKRKNPTWLPTMGQKNDPFRIFLANRYLLTGFLLKNDFVPWGFGAKASQKLIQ